TIPMAAPITCDERRRLARIAAQLVLNIPAQHIQARFAILQQYDPAFLHNLFLEASSTSLGNSMSEVSLNEPLSVDLALSLPPPVVGQIEARISKLRAELEEKVLDMHQPKGRGKYKKRVGETQDAFKRRKRESAEVG
ncbi:hypothetical protein HDU99_006018, partial [Rhizoclosmatium hyalinum]